MQTINLAQVNIVNDLVEVISNMIPFKVSSLSALADIVPIYANQIAIVNGMGVYTYDSITNSWRAADYTALETALNNYQLALNNLVTSTNERFTALEQAEIGQIEASNVNGFGGAVRATPLFNYELGEDLPLNATITIIQAFGRLQKQIIANKENKADNDITLADEAGASTLPDTAAAPVASRLQVLRNNIKQAFADIGNKQANLVSGTNIKTVGGQSLLGSGDVPLGDFLYGASDPDNGGGSDGDVYIQSDGKLWKKASGVWTYTGIQFAAQTAAVLLAGAQTVAGVKTFSDRSVHAGAYTPSAQPTHSATPTFDCATSNVFEPAALTGNVTSITLSNAVAGQTVQIRFQQDATGGRTVAVPSGAKVDGSINTAANRVSWLILTYSARGSRWEGNWLQVPL